MPEESRSPGYIDLRHLLDYHTDALREWDLATDTPYWSASLYQLLNVQPFSIQPGLRSLVDLIHPNDLVRISDLVEQRKKRKAPYRTEIRFRKRNGETLWMDCLGETFFNAKGRPTRMVGFHLDITERERKEHRRTGGTDRDRRAAS